MLECASFGDETAVNKGKKHKCWQAPLKMPEFTLAARNDRQCMFVVWLFFSLMEESTKPISFSPESLSQYQPMGRAQMRSALVFPPRIIFLRKSVHFDKRKERAAGYLEDVKFDY
jgi:hypothetical protein